MTEVFTHAKSIVSKLVRSGYIAYFAGGWVRDFVMGHPSEDIDIATSASPVEIMNLFPHTILVGLSFGVVIVVIEGHQYEVATFRKDLRYIDGRHPEGIEMSTPLEDALRRDFTINGMFYDPIEEKIHDFVHGQEDIKRGVIRTIGNPHERFFEDRLRMLRAFRFAARFKFAIDPETQEAIRENGDKMFPAVAWERVWQEFNKMSNYPRFDQALVDMHRLDLLGVIFPEIKEMHIKEIRQKVAHFSSFPPQCPTICFLMELFTSFSLDQKLEIARRIKASNKDLKLIEYMDNLEKAFFDDKNLCRSDRYRWAQLFSHSDWELGMRILSLRYGEGDDLHLFTRYADRYSELEPHIKRIRNGTPLVTSTHLTLEGIKPGKKMGVLLKESEKIAVNHDLHDARSILEKLYLHPSWTEGELN